MHRPMTTPRRRLDILRQEHVTPRLVVLDEIDHAFALISLSYLLACSLARPLCSAIARLVRRCYHDIELPVYPHAVAGVRDGLETRLRAAHGGVVDQIGGEGVEDGEFVGDFELDPVASSVVGFEVDVEFFAESRHVDVFVVARVDLHDVGDEGRRADESFEVVQDGQGGI